MIRQQSRSWVARSFSDWLRCAACHSVRLRSLCSGAASLGSYGLNGREARSARQKVCCMCWLPTQCSKCCALCSRTASCTTHRFLRSCIHGATSRTRTSRTRSENHTSIVVGVTKQPIAECFFFVYPRTRTDPMQHRCCHVPYSPTTQPQCFYHHQVGRHGLVQLSFAKVHSAGASTSH